MPRSKVDRRFYLDGHVSRALDQAAEARGFSSSALAERIIRDGLQRLAEHERRVAEALTHAGVGTAALTALLTLSTILG